MTFNELIKGIFLGFLQGVSEFLPISSSGHLVLFQNILGLQLDGGVFFEVMLHFGTLLSILVVMGKSVWKMLKNVFSKDVMMLIVATIPAAIVGLILKKEIEKLFSVRGIFVPFAITGLLILLLLKMGKHSTRKMDFDNALFMGVGQAFAVIPGLSRSGTTIFAGVLSGLSKEDATRFSMLMAIPIILASAIFEIATVEQISSPALAMSAVGGVTAFVTGIFSIKLLLKVIASDKMKYFAIYLFALSIALFLVEITVGFR